MDIKKIIVDHDKGLTTDEKCMNMLKEMEKQFNTGPIIGEARELLLNLINNLYTRDLILDALNMDVERREKMFRQVQQMMDDKDKEILDARANGSK